MIDTAFMRRIEALGIKLWLDGDAVRFSAPRGAMTPELRDQLKTYKEDIRDYLQRAPERAEDSSDTDPLPRVSRDQPLPLSFAQQRLWFLDQLEPNGSAYNIGVALRLGGALDIEALRRSFEEIVRRHEMLRTTFAAEGSAPVQIVHPPGPWALPIVDLSALPQDERENGMRTLATSELHRPFDLKAGPLLHTKLVRLAPEEYVLLSAMHHIVADGWSMDVLVRELIMLYAGFTLGEPSPLPELTIQYADFAHWQRQYLTGDVLAKQLAYWRSKFATAPTLDLPTDHPRPPISAHRGRQVPISIPADVSAQLRRLSRSNGATLFMTLLAAFSVLLGRYGRQEDVFVGTPIAGRNRAEIEPLIGFFVNTLVMRADLGKNPTFIELLRRVRDDALGAYAHQDLPFERLVEALGIPRDLSRNPLFQVMFVLQNAPLEALELAGLTIAPVDGDPETAKFDLTLTLAEQNGEIVGSFEYDVALFDEQTIARMRDHLLVLLQAITANPEQRIGDLPLLSAAEREQIVRTWNASAREYPRDSTIHELFEQQAAQRPEALALEFDDGRLTYAELDRRSNRLARRLRTERVGPDVRVGLSTERSTAMVVAILAILKAGGAYVPLDPEQPMERIEHLVRDAQVEVLVAEERLRNRLSNWFGGTIVSLDGLNETWRDDERLPLCGSASNLAYVIYTSGSTGKPKGVAVEHRSVLRLACNTDYVQIEPGQRVGQAANSAFDAMTFEIWAALLNGGQVIGISKEALLSPLDFAAMLERAQLDALFLTTALFNQMAREAPDAFSHIRQLLFGGEAVEPRWVAQVLARGAPARLLHVYGPTETTTFASWFEVKQVSDHDVTVSIGGPLSNTTLYVLNRYLQPAPIGVPGQLFIGDDALARGYLGQPSLTAERFVPDPFSDKSGARLYRSGDIVRRRAGGAIEFVGRVDHQVKIRGFRIELGEIEAALGTHPAVQQCVVLAREDEPGERRLVAYTVLKSGSETSASDLQEHLAAKLPTYMVPAVFVPLEALPITPNGKVDRAALPPPHGVSLAVRTKHTSPKTPVEEVVAGIFAHMLGHERVGLDDDFFSLGGHSLLAAQVISRVRAALNVELPVRDIFEATTVTKLAMRVEAARGITPRPPITPAPREGDIALSFAQQRMWFLDQLQPGSFSYNVPFVARVDGPLNIEALRRAFEEVVRRHETLRTTFGARNDGSPSQTITPPAPWPLPIIDLSGLSEPEEKAKRLAQQEIQRPFDLASGPLMRTTLLRLGPEAHVFILIFHHIVFDGWSLGVLIRELSSLYPAFHEGRSSPLPELPIQFADFAHWQRRWLSDDVLGALLSYWRERLANVEPLVLPTDRPRQSAPSFRGGRVMVGASCETYAALERLAQTHAATTFMLLLAAFHVLLCRYSGQDDICVGTVVAGRNPSEVEPLIGFFVNTLVLRVNVADNPTFVQLLARVKNDALGAFAHQDLPFDRLVEDLGADRAQGRNPICPVMFGTQRITLDAEPFAGLALSPVELEVDAAKFDLSLGLSEEDGALVGIMEYDGALFYRGTIERMARQFETLLQSIAANPNQRIADLQLHTPAERDRIVHEWNSSLRDYPRECTIDQVFAQQVAKTPDAMAVVFDDDALTYAELDRRANAIARRLQADGIGPDVRVGLCVERSAAMVVAILAILKAGGTYVPIDLDLPLERMEFLLRDAHVHALVIEERSRYSLPEFVTAIVSLDDPNEPQPSSEDELPLPPRASASNLAYVIYTSGSTGKPKGVAVEHRSVLRLACNTDYVQIEPGQRVGQAANSAFDAMTFEIWAALLNGGQVIGISKETLLSPLDFAAKLERAQPDALFLTTALFNQMAREAPDAFSHVRQLLFGGEAVEPRWVAQVLARGAPARLLHVYGPTETTTFASWFEVKQVSDHDVTVSIGGPLSNTTLYVLDRYLQPAPIGVPGQLFIGDDALARGYLGRPALTAERFVPDPFSDKPGSRLYRSGDIVRRRAGGAIEFVGRVDHQVKIRGFRIELGEIEAALGTHPAVQQCVVLAREDEPGERRLVAYTVLKSGSETSASDLQEHLAAKLPTYMVPAVFVPLEALPITPNGKVDRHQLPAPEQVSLLSGSSTVVPTTPIEKALAAIFADVLAIDVARIGIDDDFFELGGHSLLATKVVSRVNNNLGVELPLRTFFEESTIGRLAPIIEPLVSVIVEKRPILPIPRNGELLLSFAQQRLWFLDQLQPGSPFYNMPVVLRLRGALDVGTVQRVFSEVIRRHEALRTTFSVRNGMPIQTIAPAGPWSLPVVDLSTSPTQDEDVHKLALEECQRPFSLALGPLLRATLVRLGPEDHVLFVVMHHIVSDGWSMGVLIEEISALYPAFLAGRPSPLPELPIQYVDYASWQRQWLSGDTLAEQLSYWRARLTGAPTLNLPTDHPRPRSQSYRGSRVFVTVNAKVSAALGQLGKSQNATLFMTLLAAFAVVLHRYSQQDDLCIGTPIAGRNRAEIEPLIGFFVNTLVIRSRIDTQTTFIELLAHMREEALGAFAHQELPFERLVEDLAIERDIGRNPVFQVMFALQNVQISPISLQGLSLSPVEIDIGSAKFDLSLMLIEQGPQIVGTLTYNTDLFEENTMTRMVGHFLTLLERIVANPSQRVLDIPLTTDAERHHIVAESNATNRECLIEKRVHRLFAAQAAATPNATALVCAGLSLSYRELDERANILADRLRANGVRRATPVAVIVSVSIETIISIIAILKAGGAYVPLDPSLPSARLIGMIEDTAAPLLLASAPIAWSPPTWVRVLLVSAQEIASDQARENLPDNGDENDLAYIIFTSGTTGRPKGVAVEHRQLSHYVQAIQDRVEWPAHAKFALVSTFAADLGYTTVFPSLCGGGCLHLIPTELWLDADGLGNYLHRQTIDCLKIVPSHLGALLSVTSNPRNLLPRQRLIFGGETLNSEILETIFKLEPSCQVFNHYGPTETTIGVQAGRIDLPLRGLPKPPLGRPLANTRIYLLDHNLQPTPVGIPGEVYIGGDGVTRGYWNRPGLTAERFVPDPISGDPGARLYRTGDKARALSDKTTLFLGRTDHQIKIRGHRIELGEIEAAIRTYPSVDQCVVIARQGANEELSLIAHVVSGDGALSIATLRQHLERTLPSVMVPAAFVKLEQMPLTANGKVNRAALPSPESQHSSVEGARPSQTHIPPRTQTELELLDIWQGILAAQNIGVRDNFFQLGGHSLLAVKLLARVEERFGRAVPMSRFFLEASIEALALAINEAPVAREATSLVPLRSKGAQQPFFCVHAVDGSPFAYRALASRLGNDQPLYGFQARGLEVDEPPSNLVEEMASHYLGEMRKKQPQGPYRIGGWSFGGLVAYEMARQLVHAGEQVSLLALFDSWAPSSALERPPDDFTFLWHFIRLSGLPISCDELMTIEPTERMNAVIRRAIDAGVLPPVGGSTYLRRQHRVYTENSEAARRYHPASYPGRITLFRARDFVAPELADIVAEDPTCGWAALAPGRVAVHIVPGDHFTLLQEPNVADIAALLHHEFGIDRSR